MKAVVMDEGAVIEGVGYGPGAVVDLRPVQGKRLERQGIVARHDEEWGGKGLRGEVIRDVMVFTPVLRLEPETVVAVLALRWEGAITWVMQRDNPVGWGEGETRRGGEGAGGGVRHWVGERELAGRLNHLHQYQRGRELFLAGKYEAMLVIESDIIPPVDALEKLVALGSDVAYGVYRFRVSDVVNVFEKYPGTPRNMGESLSIHPRLLRAAVKRGKVVCSGAGLGCTLIRRRVLEQIPFRLEKHQAHCDTWFNMDVMRAGFSQWADMTVVCGHKTETGEILWPGLS